ncbi:RING-type domain-containing protein, partial [Psidium guajava]
TVMEIVISVALLFVGIAVLVAIHVCVVGRAFREGGFGRGPVRRNGNSATTKLSVEDLKKLPCFEYGSEEKASNQDVDCAVCLENFKADEKCRLLPNCKHCFHAQCIDSWLLKMPVCPVCRTAIAPLESGARLVEEARIEHNALVELT